jgi:hypothetical protein
MYYSRILTTIMCLSAAYTLFGQSLAYPIKKAEQAKSSSNEINRNDCQTGNFRSLEEIRVNPDTMYTFEADEFPHLGLVFGDDEKECRRNAIKSAIELILGDYRERYSKFVIEKIMDEAADYIDLGKGYGKNIMNGKTNKRMRRKYVTEKKEFLRFEEMEIHREALFKLFESVGNLMQNGKIMISKRNENFPTTEAQEFADKAINKFEEIYTNDKYKLTVKTNYLNPCNPLNENSSKDEIIDYFKCIRTPTLDPDIFYTIRDIRYAYIKDSLKATATISIEGFNTKTLEYISVQEFKGVGYAQKGDNNPITISKSEAVANAIMKNEEAIFDQFCGQMYKYIRNGSPIIINLPAENDDTLLQGLLNKLSKSNGFIRPQSLEPNSIGDKNNQVSKVWIEAKLDIPTTCSKSDFLIYLKNTVNTVQAGYRILNDGNVFDVVKM